MHAVGADGQYTVTLRNSATIVFTELGVWLSVDGNGTALPSNLLFNELPQAFYRYLDEMEAVTDGVYTPRRNGPRTGRQFSSSHRFRGTHVRVTASRSKNFLRSAEDKYP